MSTADSVVSAILQSPLHRIFSGSTILVRYLGAETSTEHTVAVRYADMHHGLVVAVADDEDTTWWRHFTTMGQAKVLLRGTWVPMTAHALQGADDPEAVVPLLRSYAQRYPKVAKRLEGDDLAARVDRVVVVWLRPAS